jgi:hypothetical protein
VIRVTEYRKYKARDKDCQTCLHPRCHRCPPMVDRRMLRSYGETGKTDACCSTISHFPPSFTYVMLYRPAWFVAWPLGSMNVTWKYPLPTDVASLKTRMEGCRKALQGEVTNSQHQRSSGRVSACSRKRSKRPHESDEANAVPRAVPP